LIKAKPTLLLNSHDTVKPNLHTKDPFKGLEEGKLYGLGSNDARMFSFFNYTFTNFTQVRKFLKYNLKNLLHPQKRKNSGENGLNSMLPHHSAY
jgi:hypothetical protein